MLAQGPDDPGGAACIVLMRAGDELSGSWGYLLISSGSPRLLPRGEELPGPSPLGSTGRQPRSNTNVMSREIVHLPPITAISAMIGPQSLSGVVVKGRHRNKTSLPKYLSMLGNGSHALDTPDAASAFISQL